jgi:Cu/Ag efflux protein CusF
MSKYLLRGAAIASLVVAALAFTVPAHAQGTNNAPAPEKPKRHQATGDIESIDAKAGSLVIKHKEETKTFKITEKTKFSTEEKKEAALSDLKVGDKVTVYYTEEGSDLIAHKIAPARK